MKKHVKASMKLRPTALGTGLLALDVVINTQSKTHPRCYAGGTCGNVLTILSYLDWHATPISRLSPGSAADQVLADLRARGVSTKFITAEESGSTPIIVQRISRTLAGDPRHSFSWRCPGCGAYYPGYKPVLRTAANELVGRVPQAQVFFFDRVSRGAITLANAAANRGALVVFEPSGTGDPKLFPEAWSLAHVIKYSHERLRDIADMGLKQTEREGALLEIETLGADGLRFRSRLPKALFADWTRCDAFRTPVLKDAAGAGDWCTAGILSKLAVGGLVGFRQVTSRRLRDALRYGQALASWNCAFEGARGGMYQVDRAAFKQQVQAILTGSETVPPADTPLEGASLDLLKSLCPACRKSGFAVSQTTRRRRPASR